MMVRVALVLIAVVVAGPEYYGSYVSADCKISLNSDLPTKEPLYLTHRNSQLDFVYPKSGKASSKKDRGVFELGENEELVLACPGKSNKLVRMSSSVAESHCLRGTKFSLGAKKTYGIDQLECSKNVKAVLRPNSGKKCAKTGTEMEIGFEVERDFLPLISVCHDINSADTLFVEHDILSTIGGARTFKARPDFEEGPSSLYRNVDTKNIYTQKYQEKLLNGLLGSDRGNRLIEGTYYLARGHLAPDGDFMFGNWQWSTYFYANVAPQWQKINAGHWVSLEKYLRKVADQTKEDLHVVTGTYGVLSLESDSGKEVDIYLEPNERKVRVPEVFFKIIRGKESGAAIAVVCSNNPFAKVTPLCENVAASNRWPTSWMNDYSKGQIYLCDVNDFLSKTNVLPRMKYSGILQGVGK